MVVGAARPWCVVKTHAGWRLYRAWHVTSTWPVQQGGTRNTHPDSGATSTIYVHIYIYIYTYVALAHPIGNISICPAAVRFGLVTSCFILKETLLLFWVAVCYLSDCFHLFAWCSAVVPALEATAAHDEHAREMIDTCSDMPPVSDWLFLLKLQL